MTDFVKLFIIGGMALYLLSSVAIAFLQGDTITIDGHPVLSEDFHVIPKAGAADHAPPPELFEPLTFRQYVILTLSNCKAHYLPEYPNEYAVCVVQGVTHWWDQCHTEPNFSSLHCL